jgi:hypothetical protein
MGDIANVNLGDVESLETARLLSHLNAFIRSTCTFLAAFAAGCEEKLEKHDIRVQRISAAMTLMEKKLGE